MPDRNTALADGTPIALGFIPEPLVTWADLRGIRFEEAFFRDTLKRVPAERVQALSGIEAMRDLDRRPTLDPSLFIFHVSRCGSTLLSQMLATLPEHVVIAEAGVINGILSAAPAPAERDELLRLVIRALGRNRGDQARHLFVKLTSWNVLWAQAIHRLFPDTPMVWLQRDPLAVAASHAAQPAGWAAWREAGNPALSMFGLTVAEASATSAPRFRLHALEALYRAAHDSALPWLVVDYTELPQALWGPIAGHARLSWDTSQIERMRARARFDSKAGDGQPFVAHDGTGRLSDEERRLIAERIAPLYRAIGH
jgi:hypothetical protein